MIGPYADELGNVLPNAVEGVGVPVDPLAFAGLLGILVLHRVVQLFFFCLLGYNLVADPLSLLPLSFSKR